MIGEENEKTPHCSICLQILSTNLYFTSDNHVYHRNCFDIFNFKSPICRKGFLNCFPVNKVVNGEGLMVKKDIKKIFEQ